MDDFHNEPQDYISVIALADAFGHDNVIRVLSSALESYERNVQVISEQINDLEVEKVILLKKIDTLKSWQDSARKLYPEIDTDMDMQKLRDAFSSSAE